MRFGNRLSRFPKVMHQLFNVNQKGGKIRRIDSTAVLLCRLHQRQSVVDKLHHVMLGLLGVYPFLTLICWIAHDFLTLL